ncbi:MAG: hypothetical protein ABI557_14175 [Aureliella sp.]
MLMRNPEYRLENALENQRNCIASAVDYAPREMLLGQLVLLLLFVIAILMRAMV